MGPSRSCWNGTTSALQPEEITLKGTSFMCVLSISAHTKKAWKLIYLCVCVCVYIYIYIYIYTHTHTDSSMLVH